MNSYKAIAKQEDKAKPICTLGYEANTMNVEAKTALLKKNTHVNW